MSGFSFDFHLCSSCFSFGFGGCLQVMLSSDFVWFLHFFMKFSEISDFYLFIFNVFSLVSFLLIHFWVKIKANLCHWMKVESYMYNLTIVIITKLFLPDCCIAHCISSVHRTYVPNSSSLWKTQIARLKWGHFHAVSSMFGGHRKTSGLNKGVLVR